MLWTLATRHLWVRKARGAVLLLGFAVGAGVMMVLLSIGEAMIAQSRDVALVGGGEVTVLPEGIDLEGLRTGSMAGMFFGIDRARFLERQLIGGGRLSDVVAATSPVIEQKLVYLRRGDTAVPLRAGGELPSAAVAVGAGLEIVEGQWRDAAEDERFARPSLESLYHELDRFHSPEPDSTWAEWHYFNVAPSATEWWYLTYLVGGPPDSAGRRGGQLLITRHRAGKVPARFEAWVPGAAVRFDTSRADLALGSHTVTQRGGRYRIVGSAAGPSGQARFDLEVRPAPNAYFPAVEVDNDGRPSGYVVPALRATATGTICEQAECRQVTEVAAYHDHNWGVWRATTWNWGQGRGRDASIVYGGILNDRTPVAGSRSPYFLAVVDSLGVKQVLRFATIDYRIPPGTSVPSGLSLIAARGADTLRVEVQVLAAQATPVAFAPKEFLQLRGAFTASGRLLGAAFSDQGLGFFETFVDRKRR